MSAAVIKALAVTAELLNVALSKGALGVFCDDLSCFSEDVVLAALVRCRRELTPGRFGLSDVLKRCADADGRPGAEEAWAMIPMDEYATTVWTTEMCEAWGVALPILSAGDAIAARMAFKETYTRLLARAREAQTPAKWTVTLGRDAVGRETALLAAVSKGRLTVEHVGKLLPCADASPQYVALLEKAGGAPRLGVSQ